MKQLKKGILMMKMETKNSGRKPKNKALILALAVAIVSFITITTYICIAEKEIENFKSEHNNTIAALSNINTSLNNENYMLKDKISDYETRITELEKNNKVLSNKIQDYKTLQCNVNNTEKIVNTINKWEVGQELPLPSVPSNMKLCTDYRFYNIVGTPHNRLQMVAWTDEFGCRRYNNDYIVALGSFYSIDIGDRFEVTLDTGRTFTIIMGDGKADVDTDINNMYTPCFNYDGEYCANLLEFIIDKEIMSKNAYAYGSLDYHDEFAGDIIKMVYLGRDQGGDWISYE